jgi:proteasome accessory factor A
MAIPKVCGIETEYGVLARGIDLDAVSASSCLVNMYAGREWTNAWDFSSERPYADARSSRSAEPTFPETDYYLANTVLTNGARYYVDHAHPEVSSPECRTALELLRYDLAGDEVMRISMEKAAAAFVDDAEIVVYKNNSDGKGNSYGCHENYLVDRAVPFGRLATLVTSHFVSRQIFCGSGKIGYENRIQETSLGFQLSQRADFFEEEIGLETTVRRPIINTRDEPHADAKAYRRLHVIVGDANMSQMATFLKVGSTSIVLAMIEDGAFPADLITRHPVHAIRQISADPTLCQTVEMHDGSRMTALDLQFAIYEAAQSWSRSHGLDSVDAESGSLVLEQWGRVLDDLSRDPLRARDRVDWIAKKYLCDGYVHTRNTTYDDPRLKMIDIQYHDLRRGRGLAEKMNLCQLIDVIAVEESVAEPPSSTRAFFRGYVLKKWPQFVVAANWDSLLIDTSGDHLVRIPMDEPLRGTRELTASLIDESDTPADLVRLLGLEDRNEELA